MLGGRTIKNRKPTTRPPTILPEVWYGTSPKQQKEAIKEFNEQLRRLREENPNDPRASFQHHDGESYITSSAAATHYPDMDKALSSGNEAHLSYLLASANGNTSTYLLEGAGDICGEKGRILPRTLIEFCCGPHSKLSDEKFKQDGCTCHRITEYDDITTTKGKDKAIDIINLSLIHI